MKLKAIVLLILTIYTTQVSSQENTSSILKKAIIEAKESNKNIFVKYSASWCGWCKKMDKQMVSGKCKPLFHDNYIIINLIVNESKENKHLETPGGLDLLKKHKGQDAGLPFWVVLDKNGELLEDSFNKGENLGCPASKEEVNVFASILKNTSNLNTNDLNIIKDVFILKN